MWAKLNNALKPRQPRDESSTGSHGEVMSHVYEQHPNLSVFHNAPEPQPSPPPSPSKSGRMNMFKRPTKNHDESMRAPSPMKLPSLPKKLKSTFGSHGNASQLSVAGPSELTRVESHDALSPPASHGKRRSSLNILRRGSVDGPRSPPPDSARSPSRAEESHPAEQPTTPFEAKSGSVRSILRNHNTPGTGQNVRFFSRDAYKVLSPDQSVETEYQSVMTTAVSNTPAVSNAPAPPAESFLDRLERSASTDSNASSSMPRFSSSSKPTKVRPSVAEIFSPLASPEQNPASPAAASDKSNSQLPPIPMPDFDLFDISQDLEIPIIPPPGLGFELDHDLEGATGDNLLTSTPYRDKGKGKGKEQSVDILQENLSPKGVDEMIFHAQEKSLPLPPALHNRSPSFSLGQSVFYSMAHDSSKRSSLEYPAYPSSAKSSPMSVEDSSRAPSPGLKGRGRSLSDTVFMSMLRSPSPKLPEADICDESSADLVVYNSPEPDPFSANANTYYTPQTLIPATPPDGVGAVGHARQASKEDDQSLIFSLKTQLALQTELCGQFETDLRARDELVEVLGRKLEAVEREDGKKRAVLKQWKKKVLELERACRMLEEEVEGSRQESMERSIMDEASSEALRMLHRQIAGLERDKESWKRLEDMLREEIGTLEARLREKNNDVDKLKETLTSRDESERELKLGITAVKEQMEMMGNISIGLIDETELRRIAAGETEQQQRSGAEADAGWAEEREELLAALEEAKGENVDLVEEIDEYKRRLEAHDQQLEMLKSELEAQWAHTEKGTENMEAMEAAKREVEVEREALKDVIAELEEKILGMEAELADCENKLMEQDNDIQELWDVKEALEKEQQELVEQLQDRDGHASALKQDLKAREDRIVELEQEAKYALENVYRLEENIRRRDAEAAEYSQRILQRETEAESLQEQLSRMKREHANALEAALADKNAEGEQQARAAKERARDLKEEIERLRRQVHELQQESADKEVKILQITKQRAQDKEDLQGLNIALESKQQELELLKRRMGVRGTAGSTPAQPSKVGQRRDSAIFSTPSGGSRPPSVISDAGTDGGSASGSKMPALGKSSRLNTSTSKPAPAPRAPGSMGPPAAPLGKLRPSLAGTPTPAALSRSTSARPSASTSTPVTAHRRVASATLEQSTSRTMKARQTVNASPAPGEKENLSGSQSARPGSRARVPVPTS